MQIPDSLHELLEWEIEVAYHHGYRAALADIAAGHAELDVTWRPVGRRGYERRVAERIAEMYRHAQRLRAGLHGGCLGGIGSDWQEVAVPGRPAVAARATARSRHAA